MAKDLKHDPVIILAIILFILGFVLTYGYFILKALGIINSPAWMSYIPIFTSSFMILSIAISAGKVLEKVNRIDRVENRLDRVVEDVAGIKVKVDSNKEAIEKHSLAIERLTSNVERLNSTVF